MAAWQELRAALAVATRSRRLAAGIPPPAMAAGLAWLPLGGAAIGAGAAAVAPAAQPLGRWVAAPAAAALLALLAGRPLGPATLAAIGASAAALGVLPPPAWPLALVLAAALSRWAVVVQCHGGRPAAGGDGAALVGRARFREFGVASVTAIGGALVAADALGLLAVLAAALVTMALRVLAYRRAGGLAAADLVRTEAAVETAVLAVLALAGGAR